MYGNKSAGTPEVTIAAHLAARWKNMPTTCIVLSALGLQALTFHEVSMRRKADLSRPIIL